MTRPAAALLLIAGLAAAPAAAREAATQPAGPPDARSQNPPPVNQLERDESDGQFNSDAHLLGRLPLRQRLDEAGVRVTGGLFVDGLYVLDGPSERGEIRSLGVLDVGLDSARLGLHGGGTLFARLYAGLAADGAEVFPATLQEIDSVPAFEHVTLGELWYEQLFLDGVLHLRGGRMDANSDFAYAEYASVFITDSAAVTPTNFGIPSFLDPALGVVAFAYPGRYSFGAGVYRGTLGLPSANGIGTVSFFVVELTGDAASTYALAEAGRRWDLAGDGSLPGQAKLGGWLASGEFRQLDGSRGDFISGGYLILQQALYDEGDGQQGLGAFAQLGLTDENYSEVRSQVALGLVYAGPIPGREGDQAGLYVSRAGLSGAAGADLPRDAETTIEATYQIQLRPWLQVQPDLQHVLNAGGDGRDVTLAALRVVVNF